MYNTLIKHGNPSSNKCLNKAVIGQQMGIFNKTPEINTAQTTKKYIKFII